jgi:hypothetical protein
MAQLAREAVTRCEFIHYSFVSSDRLTDDSTVGDSTRTLFEVAPTELDSGT